MSELEHQGISHIPSINTTSYMNMNTTTTPVNVNVNTTTTSSIVPSSSSTDEPTGVLELDPSSASTIDVLTSIPIPTSTMVITSSNSSNIINIPSHSQPISSSTISRRALPMKPRILARRGNNYSYTIHNPRLGPPSSASSMSSIMSSIGQNVQTVESLSTTTTGPGSGVGVGSPKIIFLRKLPAAAVAVQDTAPSHVIPIPSMPSHQQSVDQQLQEHLIQQGIVGDNGTVTIVESSDVVNVTESQNQESFTTLSTSSSVDMLNSVQQAGHHNHQITIENGSHQVISWADWAEMTSSSAGSGVGEGYIQLQNPIGSEQASVGSSGSSEIQEFQVGEHQQEVYIMNENNELNLMNGLVEVNGVVIEGQLQNIETLTPISSSSLVQIQEPQVVKKVAYQCGSDNTNTSRNSATDPNSSSGSETILFNENGSQNNSYYVVSVDDADTQVINFDSSMSSSETTTSSTDIKVDLDHINANTKGKGKKGRKKSKSTAEAEGDAGVFKAPKPAKPRRVSTPKQKRQIPVLIDAGKIAKSISEALLESIRLENEAKSAATAPTINTNTVDTNTTTTTPTPTSADITSNNMNGDDSYTDSMNNENDNKPPTLYPELPLENTKNDENKSNSYGKNDSSPKINSSSSSKDYKETSNEKKKKVATTPKDNKTKDKTRTKSQVVIVKELEIEQQHQLEHDPESVVSCWNCGCYGLDYEFIDEDFCSEACCYTFRLTTAQIEQNASRGRLSILGGKDSKGKPLTETKKNNTGCGKGKYIRNNNNSNGGSPTKGNSRRNSTQQVNQSSNTSTPNKSKGKQAGGGTATPDSKKATNNNSMNTRNSTGSKNSNSQSNKGKKEPIASTTAAANKKMSISSEKKRKSIDTNSSDSDASKNNPGPFDWPKYILDTKSKGAPQRLFRKPVFPSENPFSIRNVLEAIDPQHPSLICAVSVSEIKGYRLRLHIIGYSESYDFWVNADSDEIFPCGWSEDNGFELQPPPGQNKNFNWHQYMVEELVNAAPRQNFAIAKEEPLIQSEIQVGMKLEAVDIKNQNFVCVATVSKVIGEKFLVHFDSWDDSYDYWIDPTSPHIHPVGWCSQNNVDLTPPNGYKDFSWEKYMRETSTFPMPLRLFRPLPPVGFKKGMKIECVDKRNPLLVRVATIEEVEEHNLVIHFDNWPPIYDYKVEELSRDIHPPGWCAQTGHPLEGPPEECDVDSEWEGACPVFGCHGIGHVRGSKFSTHSSEKNCPYSNINYQKDSFLPDRIVYPIRPSVEKLNIKKEKLSSNNTSRESSPPPPLNKTASAEKPPAKQKKIPSKANNKRKSEPTATATVTRNSARKSEVINSKKIKLEKDEEKIQEPVKKSTPSPTTTTSPTTKPIPTTSKASKPQKRTMSSIELLESRINPAYLLLEEELPSNNKKQKVKYETPKKKKGPEKKRSAAAAAPFSPDITQAPPIRTSNSNSSKKIKIKKEKEKQPTTTTTIQVVAQCNSKRALSSLKQIVGDLNERVVISWGVNQVIEFVSRIPGCSSIDPLFIEHAIDGEAFLLLHQKDIQQLGIKFGPTVKLSHVIGLILSNTSSKKKSG